MRPEAIVLVGVPCSGKSTYASMFKKFYGYEIVERDQIRLEMQKERGLQPLTDTRVDYSKWNWEWPNEDIVTDRQYKLIKNLSNQLKSVVISDVNLSYRYNLIPFLRKHGYQIKVQYLYTPLHVCIQRNESRQYPIDPSVIKGHHDYLITQLQKEISYDKEPAIVICHSCEETKHLSKLIPPEHFIIRYRYNDIIYDVYRKRKEVVDVILKDNEYRKHKEMVDVILEDEKTPNKTNNEQTLLQNTELETCFIKINHKELKNKLMDILSAYKSFENTLVKLISQNYNLYKDGLELNDFHLLTSPLLMLSILYNFNVKYLDQQRYLKNKYKDNKLWQELKGIANKLNPDNLTHVIKRVKANFNLYTEMTNPYDIEEPFKINGYSVELDKHKSLSLGRLKKGLIGIRLSNGIDYIGINKEHAKNLTDKDKIHSAKVVYDNGDLYLQISYLK